MRVLAATAITVALLSTLTLSVSATDTTGCLSWCRHQHNPTEMFCCRADPNSESHFGECPQRLVANNGMDASYCRTDKHCQAYEKCCYSEYTRQSTCVAAVTNRHQPRTPPPVISVRFGGPPPLVSNNFSDLGFEHTYRNGNQGWGHMGGMEEVNEF